VSARNIIKLFGGIKAMAKKAGIPPGSISNWWNTDRIPHWRIDAIEHAAAANGIDISTALAAQPDATLSQPKSKPKNIGSTHV